LYLEVDDCQTFSEGEEVTLVRWGNFFVDKIERDDNGVVVAIQVGIGWKEMIYGRNAQYTVVKSVVLLTRFVLAVYSKKMS
jgi:hypothetical protein